MDPSGRGPLDSSPVVTCDGELLDCSEARKTARRYYIVGFFALPWFWATNIWLFFPHFLGRNSDATIRYYTRRSAVGFLFYSAVLLSWMLTYWIGGPKLLGQETYDKLDVTKVDLVAAGLASGG